MQSVSTATTDAEPPNFVPPDGRIATFDEDGTTWVEHPVSTQVVHCLDRIEVTATFRTSNGHPS